MEVQVRLYDLHPGSLAAFAEAFRTVLAPLREQFGFKVIGGWAIEDTNQFLWLAGYDGEEGFEKADDAYSTSPERKALDPNPARHIVTLRAWMVELP